MSMAELRELVDVAMNGLVQLGHTDQLANFVGTQVVELFKWEDLFLNLGKVSKGIFLNWRRGNMLCHMRRSIILHNASIFSPR